MRTEEKLQAALEDREFLVKRRDIAVRRARASKGDAAMTMIEELEGREQAIQKAYLGIDVSDFPNKVVATLSALQGQEREVRVQLGLWKNAEDAKKDIDKQIEICDQGIERLRKALEPAL